MKYFLKNLLGTIETFTDINNELIEGFRNDIKEFKTGVKEDIFIENPKVGKIVDDGDRFITSFKNYQSSNHKNSEYLQKPFTNSDSLDISNHLMISCSKTLYVHGSIFKHHAMYIGDSKVIHYSSLRIIEIDTLENFLSLGRYPCVIKSPITYEPEEVIDRAFSLLNEENYHLFSNNCEHFVQWCRSGGSYTNII